MVWEIGLRGSFTICEKCFSFEPKSKLPMILLLGETDMYRGLKDILSTMMPHLRLTLLQCH
jgi:hypothetical protein